MDMQIRKIKVDEWEKYKAIRLKSLQSHPTAFGSDFEQSSQKDDTYWAERLEKSGKEEGTFMLVADDGKNLVGTIACYWESSPKMSHVAHIVGVYVDAQQQGKGLGSQLLQATIDKIVEKTQFSKIRIEYTEGNEAAQKLYEKFDFEEVGYLKDEIKFVDEYYSVVMMERYL